MKTSLPSLVLAALATGALSLPARAEIKTWTGASDTAWGTAGNWSTSGSPAAGDQIVFGNGSPDAAQSVVLSGTVPLEYGTTSASFASAYTILFDGSGNRSYTLTGGTLALNGSSNYQRFRLGTSGTASVTIDSAIAVGGVAGNRFQIDGDGARVLNLNGGLNVGTHIWQVNAPNAQIHFRAATTTGTGSELFFSGGELVAHHVSALGSGNVRSLAGSVKTLSLASNLTVNTLRLDDTLQVRNREETASAADRTLTFSGRIFGNSTLSVVNNVNSTGRTIVQFQGDGSGSAGYHSSVAMVGGGVLRFAQGGRIDLGLSNVGISDGTGLISGAGAVEITGGGSVRLGSASTYTGATTITSGTLELTSTGSVAQTSALVLANGGVFSIARLTDASYTLGAAQGVAGTGTLDTTAKTLHIGGAISPGTAGTRGALTFHAGTLATAGSVVFDSTAQTLLRLDSLAAFDQLRFTGGTVSAKGSFQLGGDLTLLTDTGYAWKAGDSLQLLDWDSSTLDASGLFSSITGASINDSLAWDLSTLNVDGMARVVAVPEPLLLGPLAGAGLFWAWRRRKRVA